MDPPGTINPHLDLGDYTESIACAMGAHGTYTMTAGDCRR